MKQLYYWDRVGFTPIVMQCCCTLYDASTGTPTIHARFGRETVVNWPPTAVENWR